MSPEEALNVNKRQYDDKNDEQYSHENANDDVCGVVSCQLIDDARLLNSL